MAVGSSGLVLVLWFFCCRVSFLKVDDYFKAITKIVSILSGTWTWKEHDSKIRDSPLKLRKNHLI